MIGKIQKLKNKKGFTLVELIVVIAIIAILTAVIVPLIARYSAQAQYTTLQDAAQTISNTANDALSDGNQLAAISADKIVGLKTTSGSTVTFTVTIGDSDAIAVLLPGGTATTDSTVTGASGAKASSNKGVNRAAERLCASLGTTLPADCWFYISVSSSAVSGVIYSTSSTAASGAFAGLTADTNFKPVYLTDFDNAYEDASGNSVGLSGKYIALATEKGKAATPPTA